MIDVANNPDNPKQRYGIAKPSAEFVSPIALLWLTTAMHEGSIKYGRFNFREKPVEAGTYISAAKRHLDAWMSGEQVDPETGVHHLGYAMACAAILIDAEAMHTLIDNRPVDNGQYSELLAHIAAHVIPYMKPPEPRDGMTAAERWNAQQQAAYQAAQAAVQETPRAGPGPSRLATALNAVEEHERQQAMMAGVEAALKQGE